MGEFEAEQKEGGKDAIILLNQKLKTMMNISFPF